MIQENVNLNLEYLAGQHPKFDTLLILRKTQIEISAYYLSSYILANKELRGFAGTQTRRTGTCPLYN